MAYRCPVCEEPQVDATHLANHMGFTAMIRSGDHESWLDEHAPDWADDDETALAERLADIVDEVDHPIDDIDADDHGGHDHAHDHPAVDAADLAGSRARGDLDGEAAEILAEAQELTRQMADDEGETE